MTQFLKSVYHNPHLLINQWEMWYKYQKLYLIEKKYSLNNNWLPFYHLNGIRNIETQGKGVSFDSTDNYVFLGFSVSCWFVWVLHFNIWSVWVLFFLCGEAGIDRLIWLKTAFGEALYISSVEIHNFFYIMAKLECREAQFAFKSALFHWLFWR